MQGGWSLGLAAVGIPTLLWAGILTQEGPIPGVHLAGWVPESLPTGEPRALAEELEQRAQAWLDQPLALHVGQQVVHIPRRELGARVDVPATKRRLLSVGRSGFPLTDMAASLQARLVGWEVHWHVHLDRQQLTQRVHRLDQTTRTPAVRAEIDLEQQQVTRPQSGYRIHAAASEEVIAQTLITANPSAVLPLHVQQATDGPHIPEGLSLQHVMGTFETTFRQHGTEGEHINRAHNIRLAAEHLNGTIMPAHGVLSFNRQVGPRSGEAGFRAAPVLIHRQLVPGMGGGVCQVASTLHAAAFFAGLELLEHTPHTRPAGYIPMGLDATVVWPEVDLKIRNPHDHPILVHATTEGPKLRIRFLGASAPPEVGFDRTVTHALPFETRVVHDANLPRGKQSVAKRGSLGFRVHRRRIFHGHGPTGHRQTHIEHAHLRYRASPRIVHVGGS